MTAWYIFAAVILILLIVEPIRDWYKKKVKDHVDEEMKKHKDELRQFK